MKNIIIFNNRSLHLYDFKELKDNYDLRITAVVFDKSFQNLSIDIKKHLDNIYVLPDITSYYESLESFPTESLNSIVEKEVNDFPNTWIVAADELNNLILSSLRHQHSLPGTPYSVILNFRDKVVQKQALKTHGIHMPKFIALYRQNHKKGVEISYKNLTGILGSPFIVNHLICLVQ